MKRTRTDPFSCKNSLHVLLGQGEKKYCFEKTLNLGLEVQKDAYLIIGDETVKQNSTISPSLCLFILSISFLFFIHLPSQRVRDGLNGDIVAYWEQNRDAVWVCDAETPASVILLPGEGQNLP